MATNWFLNFFGLKQYRKLRVGMINYKRHCPNVYGYSCNAYFSILQQTERQAGREVIDKACFATGRLNLFLWCPHSDLLRQILKIFKPTHQPTYQSCRRTKHMYVLSFQFHFLYFIWQKIKVSTTCLCLEQILYWK